MKRSINGLLIRFAMLVIAIGCGWLAVQKAQQGLAPTTEQTVVASAMPTAPMQPAPMADPSSQPSTTQWANHEPIAAAPERFEVEPQPYEQEISQPAMQTVQVVAAEEELGYAAVPDLPPLDGGGFDAMPVNEPTAPPIDDGFALPPIDAPAIADSEPTAALAPLEPSYDNQPEASLPPISSPPAQPDYIAPSDPEPPVLQSTTSTAVAPNARFVPERQPEPLPVSEPVARVANVPALGTGGLGQARLGSLAGTGKPDTAYEGPQTPVLTLSKKAPQEIQVGREATFEITVKNTGTVTANEVTIRDEVPLGARLAETNPPAQQSPQGGIQWPIGALAPGGEQTVTMSIVPETEGEIGSVATVTFQAAASARAIATRPQLTIEHTGPTKVLVGEDVVFHITITNPGTGIASKVVLEENVPVGLRHAAGAELEHQIGDIRPGETRVLELTLKADRPGLVDNVIMARGETGLVAEHSLQLEVVAPLIQVAIQGPRRRYLQREAKFDITVANPGTAAAKNIDLVAHMPAGLEFVRTNNAGQYDQQSHSVRWNLAELPPNEMGPVEIFAKPRSMGDQKIRVEAKADLNLADSTEHIVQVDGVAALLFTVKDLADPIEVGGQTSYEIRVVNQGSKTATNLRLGAIIPVGMEAVRGEGPVRGNVDGQNIVFDPLPRLLPQGETVYRVHVKGKTPGDMRINIQVISDELAQPVSKEESTHVYADE